MPPANPPVDPIQHVIVLMLENRSFDHMLGGLSEAIPGLDGVPKAGEPARTNRADGKTYKQIDGASRALKYDPKHELAHTLNQLAKGNSGFVDDFVRAYPGSLPEDRAEIMKYFADGALPALHALAKNFTVCDKWFSSLPGPTWPNRFFVHSGTSLGRVSMPNGILDANLHWYDQTTLYDRLDEKKISWQIYYGDVPQSLLLVHQLEPENAFCYAKMPRFFRDAAGDPKDFPQFCFIEPAYYSPGATDDHPPHDVLEGEQLIASVYNALRRNDALWKSSLLVVLYDEHGGFYDHVVPPETVAPDHHVEEYTFNQLGVRVPAILVSPYVKPGVLHTVFDHTSLLRYVSDKWDLGPLGARVAAANSFAGALLAAPTAPDRLAPIVIPPPAPPDRVKFGQIESRRQPSLNGQQSALVGMTQLLESMTDVRPEALLGRSKRMVTGFDGAVDVAVERVEQFFAQQKVAAAATDTASA
ncbi:MAG TPA: alkaline phosphatase family protein [Xanthobacteraceae bacterium]|jgi:phospholipase C|nr:alkaline phosphatase family protein [Xanthobacteraceae bacterium]